VLEVLRQNHLLEGLYFVNLERTPSTALVLAPTHYALQLLLLQNVERLLDEVVHRAARATALALGLVLLLLLHDELQRAWHLLWLHLILL
jgi:hypothetical protein